MPLVFPAYNPDDGFVIGAGITFKKMSWNKNPFKWQQTFILKYASATSAIDLHYHGHFKNTFGKWDLELTGDYKTPSFIVNFYGYGNERNLVRDEKAFYRVRASSILFNPGISRSWKRHYFKGDLSFNTVKVQSASNKFISLPTTGVDSAVFTGKYFGAAGIGYTFSTADDVKYPTKGIIVNTSARYVLNLKETKKHFIQFAGSFTFYYTPIKNITLAHRIGAASNLGDFEFYQANTIGGFENLRGYWRSRFTGKSSFFQNSDIRWKITDLKGFVFRGAFGIYGFFDDGKVWIRNEHSSTIHTGYGGGIYYIPYSTLAINLYYASSHEINTVTFRTGFLF